MIFGRTSLLHLATCDKRMQAVANRAIGWQIYDFSVICGHRSQDQQLIEYRAGRSQLDGVLKRSKHNLAPALAFDLLPWPAWVNGLNVWDDHQRFHVLAGIILAAGRVEGVPIRWGGDWDGDGNNLDSSLHDLPHFEILADA